MPLFHSLRYRPDDDLDFLQLCEDKELALLSEVLTGPENDRNLTGELYEHERFKTCNGAYSKIWDLIAAELQTFGADSLASMLRGKGVPYRELLEEVCARVGAPFRRNGTVVEVEQSLLLCIAAQAFATMDREQTHAFVGALGGAVKDLTPEELLGMTNAALGSNRQFLFLLAQALAFSATSTFTPGLFTWLAPSGLGIICLLPRDIQQMLLPGLQTLPTGPAFRITIPACIVVAYLRQRMLNKDLL